MLGYRNNDAVLTICQNNAAKSIEIIGVNEAATALVGYSTAELAGRTLTQLIPERLAALISEYVEYGEDANDVGVVLSKVRSFGFHTKDLKEKNFRLKVVRGHSTKGEMTFKLVLQDTLDVRKNDALHQLIQENFKGHEVLHASLGVPNRQSLEKDMELLGYYHNKAGIRASFVMVQLDHAAAMQQQYGPERFAQFLKHIAYICRTNLRPGDVVGAASDTQLGLLLLDSVMDATRMVANRLRWQITAQPYPLPGNTSLPLSASMAYADVSSGATALEIIDKGLAKLSTLPAGATSQLVEI